MKLLYLNLPQIQIERIYEFLKNLNDCNTDLMSRCKISGMDLRISSDKSFFCSYVMSFYGESDGQEIEIKYVEIKPNGTKVNLLEVYRNENEITFIMNKMDKIEI